MQRIGASPAKSQGRECYARVLGASARLVMAQPLSFPPMYSRLIKRLCVSHSEVLGVAGGLLSSALDADTVEMLDVLQPAAELEVVAVLEEIYAHCPLEEAQRLASAGLARENQAEYSGSLAYGEADFDVLLTILRVAAAEVRPAAGAGAARPRRKFVDLGSGSGRAVFTAALVLELDEALGVEILPELDAAAQRALDTWSRTIEQELFHTPANTSTQMPQGWEGAAPPRVTFALGDFRAAVPPSACAGTGATAAPPPSFSAAAAAAAAGWLLDADIVFANSTCFDDGLLRALTAAVETHLRPGAVVVSATTALPTLWLEVVHKQRFERGNNHGPATLFVHRVLSAREHAARTAPGRGVPTPYDSDQGLVLPGMQTCADEDMDSMDAQRSASASVSESASWRSETGSESRALSAARPWRP